MKLFVIAVTLASACYAAQLERGYLPPAGAHSAGGSPGALQAPGFTFPGTHDDHSGAASFGSNTVFNAPPTSDEARGGQSNSSPLSGSYGAPSQFYGVPSHTGRHAAPERYRNSADSNARIIHQDSDVTSDGFKYSFETDNGIKVYASGTAGGGVRSQGGFSHESDSGKTYGNDAASGRYSSPSDSRSFAHVGSSSTASQSYQPFYAQPIFQSKPATFQQYNAPSSQISNQSSRKPSYLPPIQSSGINSAQYNTRTSPQFSGSLHPSAFHQHKSQFKPTSINSQLEDFSNTQFDGSSSSPDVGASSLSAQYGTPNTHGGSARYNSSPPPHADASSSRSGIPSSFGSSSSASPYNYHVSGVNPSSQFNSPSQQYNTPNSFASAPSTQYGSPKSEIEAFDSFATSPQYGAPRQQGFASPGSLGSQFGAPRNPPSFSPESGYRY